jgi:hypothetical protein
MAGLPANIDFYTPFQSWCEFRRTSGRGCEAKRGRGSYIVGTFSVFEYRNWKVTIMA